MRPAVTRLISSADTRAILGIIAFIVVFFSPAWLRGTSFWTDGQFNAYFAPLETWSDAWIGGWPVGADTAAFVWYPVRIALLYLHFPFDAFVLFAYVIAALGAYAYLRLLPVSPLAAATGGLGFAFSGFMIAQFGHTSMVQAAAWVPTMFAGVEGAFARQQRRWSFMTALAVAMALLAGHMQIAFYGIVVLAAYLAWRLPACWHQGRLHGWWLGVLGVLAGILLAGPQLLMTLSYIAETPRVTLTYALFVSYSLPLIHLPTILFPYLLGDGSFTGQPFFGPEPFVETCCYVPFLAFALALPALRFRPGIAQFWALVSVVALALALGGAIPWLAAFMFHVPGFNLFRAPARHVMEISLAMSVLSGLGVQGIVTAKSRSARAYFAVAVALAVAVVLASIPAWTFIENHTNSTIALQPWQRNPAIGVGLIGVVSGVVAFAALVWRFRYSSALFAAAMLVGIGTFAPFSYWRYMSRPKLEVGPLESALAQQLRDAGGRFLYTDWLWNPDISAARARTLGMPSVNWYGPLIPDRAKELLGVEVSGEIHTETLGSDNVALDVYGVRFAAIRDRTPAREAEARMMLAPRWERLGTENGTTFYRNARALPLGWLCPAWRRVSPDEAVAAIRNAAEHGFDPHREALVEGLPSGGDTGAAAGTVDVAWENSSTVRARVYAPSQTFLVVSVNGLPGWIATVDGVTQPVYSTDYALLGVPVPSGRHEVILRYRVPVWRWAVPWAGALVAILCIVYLARRRAFSEDEGGHRH